MPGSLDSLDSSYRPLSLAPAIPSTPAGVQDSNQAKLWKAIGDQYRRGVSSGGNQFPGNLTPVHPAHQTMTLASGPQAQLNIAQQRQLDADRAQHSTAQLFDQSLRHGNPQHQGKTPRNPQLLALIRKLESLSIHDLEVRVGTWREKMSALEVRVRGLLGAASRPDAGPGMGAAYRQAKSDLDLNRFLLTQAQEIIKRKHAQTQDQIAQAPGQIHGQAQAAAQLAPALGEPVLLESSPQGQALGIPGWPSQPRSSSTAKPFSLDLLPDTRPNLFQSFPPPSPGTEHQSQQTTFPQNGRQNHAIPRDRVAFMHLMRLWFIQTGRNTDVISKIGDDPVDLYQLYIEVETLGGAEKVRDTGLWRLVAVKMGYMMYVTNNPQLAQIAKVFADAYTDLLVPFESYCVDRMRAAGTDIQSNQLSPMDLTQQNVLDANQVFPLGLRQGPASTGPDDEVAAFREANFQRILLFLQVTLKDWLPELPPGTKLLRAAQMDLPAMQSEGWSTDRIKVTQRFRPALVQLHASVMHQRYQALGQLSRSESDMSITTLSENATLTESQGEKDEKVEPSDLTGFTTKGLSTSERELGRDNLGAGSKAETHVMRGTKRHLEGTREQNNNIEEHGTAPKRGKIICRDYVDISPNRIDSPTLQEDITESTAQDVDDSACDAHTNADTQPGQISCEEIFRCLLDHGCVDLSSHMDPDQYSSGLIIGGAFGDIWKGKLRDGTEVAIKVWRFSSLLHNGWKTMKRAMREIYYWSKAKHEYVQELMGVIMFQGRLGMVSRWMEHGNLREYICKNLSVDRYALCMQVATGIAYLHSREMVHGDLKGTNILVSGDGVTKLSDFDHSIMSDCSLAFSETSKMGGGTTRWMAPELIINDNCNRNAYTDVYALGMTMLEIITGNSPYYPQFKTDVSVMWAVVKKTLPTRSMDHLGDNLRGNQMWELLLSCWSYDPLARPKAAEVVESLRVITSPPTGGPA